MKNDCSKYLLLFSSVLLVTWIISCSGRSGKSSPDSLAQTSDEKEEPAPRLIRMLLPEENAEYRLGDQVKVSLTEQGNNNSPDSVAISFDGRIVKVLKSAPWEFSIPPSFTTTTGRKHLKAVAFKNSRSQAVIRFVIIYSDRTPKRVGFKVVHTYPHDRDAFTQGLFFQNGFLYEGTGQETGSSLREVELESGKILRQLNLESSVFGEGITLYRDRIFQVTWQNKVGFVYDRATFRLINKVYYQTQGWGLTTMDDRIVMSDGSNVLYFIEPESFTIVSRIEAYDNEKKIDQLNELEYINGEIWANIWMSDLIARIDPATGAVNSYVDLAAIFPEANRQEVNADVLNGIAYDALNNRIFVTGKRWPKLFEIRITE
ncbi:MAG TPA: glutaminyl-peptide cyclotransferase [Bacteroidales bacterium]|nr:glutaminyl-peptide cyclotransferase [Bacteroidales bacterium]